MPSCAVITCRTRSQVSSVAQGGISFHRFPKERNLRKQWIKITGRELWVPTRTSTICSRHFSDDDFIMKTSGNRFLRMGAVPCQKIVKIHSNVQFETNAANAAVCTTEVKTERLEEPMSPESSLTGDSEERPLRTGRLGTITVDPLSPKNDSSPSDAESNSSNDARFKRSKDTSLSKKLKEKDETCKGHINKIELLLKANRRLCQQNKNLKRILMTMKKKITILQGKSGIQKDDEDSS